MKLTYILMLGLCVIMCATYSNSPYPKLLIKIPTRSRPDQFFTALDSFYQQLSGTVPYHFVITCDIDDPSMNNPKMITKLREYPHLSFYFGANKSKIQAYNSDIDTQLDFDILLVVSDDSIAQVKGYDCIIADTMQTHFPDFDGVLNFHDGHVGAQCNTLPIIGKTFYQRFGYIYHPSYKSLYCDEELTMVSKILGKEFYSDQVIIRHDHSMYTKKKLDFLYQQNNKHSHADEKIFKQRRKKNFDIQESTLKSIFKKDWSILILTLPERKKSFDLIYHTLKKQIHENGLSDNIEILYFLDDGHMSIGAKRNSLLQQSKSLYISYVDDDDNVSDDYIKTIYEKLQKNPDCVSLMGIKTTNGQEAQMFVHSIAHTTWNQKDGVYYRPPNHLNPIKRSIAVQFLFPEINGGEDQDWSMQIARSKLLKTEQKVDTPYYFYVYDTQKSKAQTNSRATRLNITPSHEIALRKRMKRLLENKRKQKRAI